MQFYLKSHNTPFRATITFDENNQNYLLQQNNETRLVVPASELTTIDTHGQIGENGKKGQNGTNGSNGLKGEDAYHRFGVEYPGKNGSPGTDATDGMPGTNGENGKDGGDVDIDYDEKNKDLLDALIILTEGGRGGIKGSHGKGGLGGLGGAGGHSYSYWIRVPHVHYQRWGADFYNTCSYDHICTFTATSSCPADLFVYSPHHHGHHHHGYEPPHIEYTWVKRTIPGGLPGPNGRDGITPRFELKDGIKGRDGRIAYHRTGGNLPQRHTQCYQFKFLNITINGTSVADLSKRKFEYGELIEITHISLSNPPKNQALSHTMSTPESNQVYLYPSNFIQPLNISYVREIPANTQVFCDSPLTFQIKHLTKDAHAIPTYEQVPLTLAVYNPRLKRDYQGAKQTYTISVGYPFSLETSPKQQSVFSGHSLTISSLVKRDPAFQPSIGETRKFFVRFHRGNQHQDSMQALTNWPTLFTHADSGSCVAHETLYISLYWPKLNLNSEPQEYVEIQRQAIDVQITPAYQPNPSGYLLVINGETPQERINTCYQHLRTLAYGYKNTSQSVYDEQAISIWNVSTYNGFDLTNSEYPLAAHTKNGCIVILDNSFDSKSGSSSYLTYKSLQEAGKHHVRLIHVGNPEQENRLRYMDTDRSNKLDESSSMMVEYQSIHELIGKLFQKSAEGSQEIHAFKLKQGENHLTVIEKMRQKLQKVFPNRRYAIVYDNVQFSIKIQQISASCITYFSEIPSEQVLIQSSPFLQKLNTIFKYHTAEHIHHERYLSAILKDLQDERMQLAKSQDYISLYQRYYHDFANELTCLNQLLVKVNEMDLQYLEAFTPLLIQIIIEAQYDAQKHTSFWTWLASFFMVQNDQKLKASTEFLSHQILNKTVDKNAKAKVELQLKLKCYIEQKNNHLFFRPGKPEDFAAALEILNACQNSESIIIRKSNSKYLKSFYHEFTKLYPDRLLEQTLSVEQRMG